MTAADPHQPRSLRPLRALLGALLLALPLGVGCGGGEPPAGAAPEPAAGSEWDAMHWDRGSWR